jgi:four helix bundle protein
MTSGQGEPKYDLEERTYQFARRGRQFLKVIPRTPGNFEDGKQLIRSSGSVGANYIEANEFLGERDFLLHIKICRKEAKESRYWSRLLDLEGNGELEPERRAIVQEAEELMRIFGAIFRKRSG